MRSFQQAFQRWLKADQRRITWVMILLVVCVGGMGLLLAWANSNTSSVLMADGTPDRLGSPMYFVEVFFKMVGVILLLLGAAYFLRRWKGKTDTTAATERQMQKLETLQLSPRQALHLVKVGDEIFLLGATDQSLTLISDVELSDETVTQMNAKTSMKAFDFGSLLSNQLKQTDRKDAASVPATAKRE